MATISIGKSNATLTFCYGSDRTFVMGLQIESPVKKNADQYLIGGVRRENHIASICDVDPLLLDAALLELGYQKIPKS
jgi:hypothetical protein